MSHKTVEIKVHLLFCLMMEGSGSVQVMKNSDLGGSKNYWAGGSTTLALAVYFLTHRTDQKQMSCFPQAQKILIGNVPVYGKYFLSCLETYTRV